MQCSENTYITWGGGGGKGENDMIVSFPSHIKSYVISLPYNLYWVACYNYKHVSPSIRVES